MCEDILRIMLKDPRAHNKEKVDPLNFHFIIKWKHIVPCLSTCVSCEKTKSIQWRKQDYTILGMNAPIVCYCAWTYSILYQIRLPYGLPRLKSTLYCMLYRHRSQENSNMNLILPDLSFSRYTFCWWPGRPLDKTQLV